MENQLNREIKMVPLREDELAWYEALRSHCQGCKHGNNKKGKYIEGLMKGISIDGGPYWNVYCEKFERYYRWDKHKKCFTKK